MTAAFESASAAALAADAQVRIAGEKELIRWRAAVAAGAESALGGLSSLVRRAPPASEPIRLHAALILAGAAPNGPHAVKALLDTLASGAAASPQPLRRVFAHSWAQVLLRSWKRSHRCQDSETATAAEVSWATCIREVQDSGPAALPAVSLLKAGAEAMTVEADVDADGQAKQSSCTTIRLLRPYLLLVLQLLESNAELALQALEAAEALFSVTADGGPPFALACLDCTEVRDLCGRLFSAVATASTAASGQLAESHARNVVGGIAVTADTLAQHDVLGRCLAYAMESLRAKAFALNSTAGALAQDVIIAIAELADTVAVAGASLGPIRAAEVAGPEGIALLADVPVLICRYRGGFSECGRLHEALEHFLKCFASWATHPSLGHALEAAGNNASAAASLQQGGRRVFEAFACCYAAANAAGRAGVDEEDDDLEEPCECDGDDGWGGSRVAVCAERAARIGRAFGAVEALGALQTSLDRAADMVHAACNSGSMPSTEVWDEMCLLLMLSADVAFSHKEVASTSSTTPTFYTVLAGHIVPSWIAKAVEAVRPSPWPDDVRVHGALARLGKAAFRLLRELSACAGSASPAAVAAAVRLVMHAAAALHDVRAGPLMELRAETENAAYVLQTILQHWPGEKQLERVCFGALAVVLPLGPWNSQSRQLVNNVVVENHFGSLSPVAPASPGWKHTTLSGSLVEGLSTVAIFTASLAGQPKVDELLETALPRIAGALISEHHKDGQTIAAASLRARSLRGLLRGAMAYARGFSAAPVQPLQRLLQWLGSPCSHGHSSWLEVVASPAAGPRAHLLQWMPLRRESLRLTLAVANAVAAVSDTSAGFHDVLAAAAAGAVATGKSVGKDSSEELAECMELALRIAALAGQSGPAALRRLDAVLGQLRTPSAQAATRGENGRCNASCVELAAGRPKLQQVLFALLEQALSGGDGSVAILTGSPALASDILALLTAATGQPYGGFTLSAKQNAAAAVAHLASAVDGGTANSVLDTWLAQWLWAQVKNTRVDDPSSLTKPSMSVAAAVRSVLHRFTGDASGAGCLLNTLKAFAPSCTTSDPGLEQSLTNVLGAVACRRTCHSEYSDALGDLCARVRLAVAMVS